MSSEFNSEICLYQLCDMLISVGAPVLKNDRQFLGKGSKFTIVTHKK